MLKSYKICSTKGVTVSFQKSTGLCGRRARLLYKKPFFPASSPILDFLFFVKTILRKTKRQVCLWVRFQSSGAVRLSLSPDTFPIYSAWNVRFCFTSCMYWQKVCFRTVSNTFMTCAFRKALMIAVIVWLRPGLVPVQRETRLHLRVKFCEPDIINVWMAKFLLGSFKIDKNLVKLWNRCNFLVVGFWKRFQC